MDAIEQLISLFERFPGIGPRQAQRFVQFLLRSSPSVRRELVDAVQSLGGSVRQCPRCMRFSSSSAKLCSMCSNPQRDPKLLAVVASDADIAALERGGTYRGYYFVLGGTISLASEKTNGLRIKQLLDSVPARIKAGLTEIILAFPANPEGDATAIQVRERLQQGFPSLKITSLGRGLSTGSELEYADPETIKSALESRR
ncbi:recombination protein RecR [Candidatus Kaiserbacteria bacterium]|nr:recombination protein RecR [Candidatus Kaiserbacteria bacterium]